MTTTYDTDVRSEPFSAWRCGIKGCVTCKKNEDDYRLEQARASLADSRDRLRKMGQAVTEAEKLVYQINSERAEEARQTAKKAELEATKRRQAEEALEATKLRLQRKREERAITDREASGYLLRLIDSLVDGLPKTADGIADYLAGKGSSGRRFAGDSNALAKWLQKEGNKGAKMWYGDDAPTVTVFVEREAILFETPRFQVTFDVQDHVKKFIASLELGRYQQIIG